MEKRVWQRRTLLLILWVLGCFLGVFAESAMADESYFYSASYFSYCFRTAKEDPYYHAQFNPNPDIRFEAVISLKLEECEGLIIQKALYDSDSDVRRVAVIKLNSPQYVNLMWEIFWKDDSGRVQRDALDNLINNMDMTEKNSLQKEFIEIIMDEENEDFRAFDGLNKQTNQEFLYYLVDRYIVENDGYYINSKWLMALNYINFEEKIKLIEEIKNHFANLGEGIKDCLDRHYQNALEESNRKSAAK